MLKVGDNLNRGMFTLMRIVLTSKWKELKIEFGNLDWVGNGSAYERREGGSNQDC